MAVDATVLYAVESGSTPDSPTILLIERPIVMTPEELEQAIVGAEPKEAVRIAVDFLSNMGSYSGTDKAVYMAHVLNGLWTDVLHKLKPYYEAEKTDNALKAVLDIDAEHLVRYIKQQDWMQEKRGALSGTWVDMFLDQTGKKIKH